MAPGANEKNDWARHFARKARGGSAHGARRRLLAGLSPAQGELLRDKGITQSAALACDAQQEWRGAVSEKTEYK